MTFTEHMSVWNGLYPDLDNAFGGQCMDEMHLYHVEVLGLTNKWYLAASGPKEIWNTFDTIAGHEYFEKVVNTPTNVAQAGDIVIFNIGIYGHVSIFIEGDTNRFTSFEQNYPTGSPCHVQEHTYTSVLGWLHPKNIQQDLQTQLDQTRSERDRNWTWFVAVCEALGVGANVDAAINEAKKLVSNDDVLVIRDKQIAEANTHVADLQAQITALKVDHDQLTAEIATQARTIQDQDRQIQTLSNSVEALKNKLQQPIKTGWQLMIDGFIKLLHGR